MLKKLAKYGNSTALVIDKAILEILEIEESSVVKLHTDGKSLIITPIKTQQQTDKISWEAEEAMRTSLQSFNNQRLQEYHKYAALDHVTKDTLKAQVDLIMAKYEKEFHRFLSEVSTSDTFKDEAAKIAQTYDPVTQATEYITEYTKLKYKFCPELEKMDQELNAASAVYSKTV